MATQTTAVLKPNPLRHRTHVLDGKTHTTHSITFPSGSVTSSDSKDFSFTSDCEGKESERESHRRQVSVEDESESESEASENAADVTNVQRPTEQDASGPPDSNFLAQGDVNSQKIHPSRAWYEFDLAVLVALVSPIGNWLTGGDYIKNVCLIMLLIFYLHQIIEGSFLSDILSDSLTYAV